MLNTRSVLFALPIVTIGVIVFAVFVVGAPRSYFGARVYGGPTEGVSVLSLRLAVVERFAEIESPAPAGPIAVEAQLGDGRRAAAKGAVDERGSASVRLELPGGALSGPVRLRVTQPRGRGEALVLADAAARLSLADWSIRAREQGGWLRGAKQGEVAIRVAAARGALAVPFTDPLWLSVRGPLGSAGARLKLELDGAKVVRPGGELVTDERGFLEVLVVPSAHVATLSVEAHTSTGATGSWHGTLPVVPGALRASLDGSKLRIESPIERDVAYFAILGPSARIAGGLVALEPNGRGGAVALVDVPPLPPGSLWGVVSSEPELDSVATVGWPLRSVPPADPATPPLARAVPDQLLVDGLSLGHRSELERRARARSIALVFTLLAAGLAALLLFREARRAAQRLDDHLRQAGADGEVVDAIGQRRSSWLGVLIAVLCVGMGFAVVALVAMYRIG